MKLQVTQPKNERYIDETVKAGDLPSPAVVVDSAVAQMMLEESGLPDDAIAAINRAAEQFERGEGIDFDEFEAAFRQKNGLK